MSIITRTSKGSALTYAELDNNFAELNNKSTVNLTQYNFGANTPADNATILMNMRSDLAGPSKPFYNIIFPYISTGIVSSNNRFLHNIGKFALYGNGSRFSTNYTGGAEAFVRPFLTGGLFQTNTLEYNGSVEFTPQYLFNTVVAGRKTITLTTASQAANFAVGNLVLIYGRDIAAGGFPPGAMYFGYYTITGVNTTTGVLTFDRPLKYTYKSTWVETPDETIVQRGKARIINLDRSNGSFCRHAEFHDLVFGAGAAGQDGNLVFSARKLIVENAICESGYTWASENETAIYENCDIDKTEWDRLVGKVLVRNSRIRGANTGGFGTEDIEFDNIEMGDKTFISPRYLSLKKCSINSTDGSKALTLSPGANPQRLIKLEEIIQTSGENSVSDAGVTAAYVFTFSIPSVSGKDIIMPYGTALDANATHVNHWEEGRTRIYKNDGTKAGYVTNITKTGSNWVISGTWPTPVASETWCYCPVENVLDLGGHMILDSKPFFDNDCVKYQGNQSTGSIKKMVITEKDFVWATQRQCRFYVNIISIEVYITKAAQSSTCTFSFDSFVNAIFNGKQVGRRKWTKTANTGIQSGDTYDSTLFEAFSPVIGLTGNISGTISLDMLPEFTMIVEWMLP